MDELVLVILLIVGTAIVDDIDGSTLVWKDGNAELGNEVGVSDGAIVGSIVGTAVCVTLKVGEAELGNEVGVSDGAMVKFIVDAAVRV